jgi:hypothetical protein
MVFFLNHPDGIPLSDFTRKEEAVPFYTVRYNGNSEVRFEGVDDEDGLYIGLSRVPPPTLAVAPRPERATKIMLREFPCIMETPVTITRDDGKPIFKGVRRHPMTNYHQFEGVAIDKPEFTWDP